MGDNEKGEKVAPARKGGKLNIFNAGGRPDPCTAQNDNCPQQCLCYVNSRKTRHVSRSFEKAEVDLLKRSSVAIGYEASNFPREIFGSGTLIGPNLVLTCEHVIAYFMTKNTATFSESNLFVLFDYEYTSQTVDSISPQLNQFVQKNVACVKEDGDVNCEDYALLVLNDTMPSSRISRISNRAVSTDEDLLLIQHPGPTAGEKQNNRSLNVTRVSGGPVQSVDGSCFFYAYVRGQPGSSGSGVFDKNHCLVGVYKGPTETGSHNNAAGWIVQMKDIVKRSRHLNAKFANQVTCLTLNEGVLCVS